MSLLLSPSPAGHHPLPLLNAPLPSSLPPPQLPLPAPPPSPLPLPTKRTAGLLPKNCNKVSGAVWLRGETFPLPIPRRRGGRTPLQHYSPAEVRLSGPSEVLLALGPVGSSEAPRSILPLPVACSPVHPRRLRQRRPPVPEHEPRSPEGGLPGAVAASAASKPRFSPHSLLPRLPLTSPRHINIRKQMHINLFGPEQPLPASDCPRSPGASGKPAGAGLRQPHQGGGFLPTCSCAPRSSLPVRSRSLQRQMRREYSSHPPPSSPGQNEPGLVPNPTCGWLGQVAGARGDSSWILQMASSDHSMPVP